MKKISILLALMLLPLAVNAQFVVFDGVLYFFDDYSLTARVEGAENIEISGGIEIPDTIRYNGHDFIVTSIASYAFRDCTKLTCINIPNSVILAWRRAGLHIPGGTSVTRPNKQA